jgi:plasminogen activator inhibitor 1 RNA-binding protein
MPITAPKERHHVDTKDHHFQGKRTEKWHPFDRKDGTGRGRGGPAKGGAGKGNWGTVKDEIQTSPAPTTEVKEGEEGTTPAEEAKVEDAPVEEATPAVEEKPVAVDKEEEENKNKLTYQEYLAQKKRSTLKKDTRAHEEVKRTGLEAAAPKKEKVS